MKNKKGISAIVATVLIILITVAAVTIIWAAIIPMINNQLQSGTVCLDAVSQVSILDEGYTCWDNATKTLNVQIKRNAKDFELADVNVFVSLSGNSYSNFTGDTPNPNEEKVYYLTFDNLDGVDADADTNPMTVEIAPVIDVGNTQESCEISSTRELTNC